MKFTWPVLFKVVDLLLVLVDSTFLHMIPQQFLSSFKKGNSTRITPKCFLLLSVGRWQWRQARRRRCVFVLHNFEALQCLSERYNLCPSCCHWSCNGLVMVGLLLEVASDCPTSVHHCTMDVGGKKYKLGDCYLNAFFQFWSRVINMLWFERILSERGAFSRPDVCLTLIHKCERILSIFITMTERWSKDWGAEKYLNQGC